MNRLQECEMDALKNIWIETYTGRRVHPWAMKADDVHVPDIAHALSQICRFAGNTKKFYSVAEHSVLIARSLLSSGFVRFHRTKVLAALFHDAAEAYIGDIVGPIKRNLGGVKELEEIISYAISEHVGCPYPWPGIVKWHDETILASEHKFAFMCPDKNVWDADICFVEDGYKPHLWTPSEAEKEFLQLYEHLSKEEENNNG